MKTMKLLKIMFLLAMIAGFTACEKNYYSEIENTNQKLCASTWTRKYEIEGTTDVYRHSLKFNTDGTGSEVTSITTHGSSHTTTYAISWKWLDSNREGLYISRVAGDTYEIHNVWIRANYLSGEYDGEQVTFKSE